MLLIETDSRFTSIINVYILCIEKELRNIKILRNAKKNPKNLFRSFDVEKRLISIKKLVEKMKSYDEDPKTLKTLNGYCDYYEILLKDYQNGKLWWLKKRINKTILFFYIFFNNVLSFFGTFFY